MLKKKIASSPSSDACGSVSNQDSSGDLEGQNKTVRLQLKEESMLANGENKNSKREGGGEQAKSVPGLARRLSLTEKRKTPIGNTGVSNQEQFSWPRRNRTERGPSPMKRAFQPSPNRERGKKGLVPRRRHKGRKKTTCLDSEGGSI